MGNGGSAVCACEAVDHLGAKRQEQDAVDAAHDDTKFQGSGDFTHAAYDPGPAKDGKEKADDAGSDCSDGDKDLATAMLRTMKTLKVAEVPGVEGAQTEDVDSDLEEEERRKAEREQEVSQLVMQSMKSELQLQRAVSDRAAAVNEANKRLSEIRVSEHSDDKAAKTLSITKEEGQEEVEKKRLTRRSTRHIAKDVRLIDTMGTVTSNRLQLIIENPRDINEFYEFRGILGEGAYGSVSKASVRGTGAIRAVKAIAKAQMASSMDRLKAELSVTKMVDHPNVIKLYEIYEDKKNIYLVMELCWGGELLDRVVKHECLSEQQTHHVMMQIFRAVYYLHSNLIMHRDLKPQNVLIVAKEPIDKAHLKISDFGMGLQFEKGQTFKAQVGTLAFMAPEVLTGIGYREFCDDWSCGVIMFFCLGGYLPFLGRNKEATRAKVLHKRLTFIGEGWKGITEEATSLMHGLLRKHPNERLSARQALSHPWSQKLQQRRTGSVHLQRDLIERLLSFRGLNRFKKAALQLIVSLLNEKQTGELCEAFMALDIDGDGFLDVNELADRLQLDNKEEIRQIFMADAEDSTLVDYSFTEFLAATFDRDRYLRKDVCKVAYSVFDQDGDGDITISELLNGRMLGNLSQDEIVKMVEDLDTNGDGKIDFEEFTDMMRGRREENKWEREVRTRASIRMMGLTGGTPTGGSPVLTPENSPPSSPQASGVGTAKRPAAPKAAGTPVSTAGSPTHGSAAAAPNGTGDGTSPFFPTEAARAPRGAALVAANTSEAAAGTNPAAKGAAPLSGRGASAAVGKAKAKGTGPSAATASSPKAKAKVAARPESPSPSPAQAAPATQSSDSPARGRKAPGEGGTARARSATPAKEVKPAAAVEKTPPKKVPARKSEVAEKKAPSGKIAPSKAKTSPSRPKTSGDAGDAGGTKLKRRPPGK
eukprot:TRINITY_DN13455_c0_g1_i1.p1 TRINITY_DN13455_c0_g1~~TRINITY_DN13455_c0_g1_i1.p1  ORF type:complete len:932 (-),score=187.23 TRINITY_DN13455_c0_g1_i1:327-3122(-)